MKVRSRKRSSSEKTSVRMYFVAINTVGTISSDWLIFLIGAKESEEVYARLVQISDVFIGWKHAGMF